MVVLPSYYGVHQLVDGLVYGVLPAALLSVISSVNIASASLLASPIILKKYGGKQSLVLPAAVVLAA